MYTVQWNLEKHRKVEQTCTLGL